MQGDKQRNPMSAVIIAVIAVVILGVGAYFLFFSSAPAIQNIISVPPNLQSIAQASKINTSIVQSLPSSQAYTNLTSTVQAQQPSGYGRSDPFQPY